jgi:hypothetical protein
VTPTLKATPSDLRVDPVTLSPARVPSDASVLPPARQAVTVDDDDHDCEECDNTGRTVFGMYGGKVVYVGWCPECGREERDC